MTAAIAVRGSVATEPRHLVTREGVAVTCFRLVDGRRRAGPDSEAVADADGDASSFTVNAAGELARNAAECLAVGDPVVVVGRLSVREWLGEQSGVSAEIDADGIGHDLTWGCAAFTRSVAGKWLAADADRAAPDEPPVARPLLSEL